MVVKGLFLRPHGGFGMVNIRLLVMANGRQLYTGRKLDSAVATTQFAVLVIN